MSTDDRTRDPLGINARLARLDELLRENARLREENLELRRLLVEVAETFAGVDPIGIDLRDRISEFVRVEPSHEH
jgi:hypothetical protein